MLPHDKCLSRFWAGGFLFNPNARTVLLHQRDGNTKINPYKWAFFGGLNEDGESFAECFVRELEEEISLKLEPSSITCLREYENEEMKTYRVVFYALSDIDTAKLTLGEGAGFGWVPLDRLNEYDLTEKTAEDLAYFQDQSS